MNNYVRVEFEDRSLRLRQTRPNASSLLEALLLQLERHRPDIQTDVAACNALRQELLQELRRRLPNDQRLRNVLQGKLREEGRYDNDVSLDENCRIEIDRLEDPAVFCGAEVVPAFADLHHMNVAMLSPDHTIEATLVGVNDTAFIWFNGVDHYDSVCNFESRQQRLNIAKRKYRLQFEL